MAAEMQCAGCNHEFEPGDRYIEDTSSGFISHDPEPGVDDIIAEIFGGDDGKVRFCEDCIEPGGRYSVKTYYGDDD